MNETIVRADELVQEMCNAQLTRVLLDRYLDRLKADLNADKIPAPDSEELRLVEDMRDIAGERTGDAHTELLALVERLTDTISHLTGEGLTGNPAPAEKGGE